MQTAYARPNFLTGEDLADGGNAALLSLLSPGRPVRVADVDSAPAAVDSVQCTLRPKGLLWIRSRVFHMPPRRQRSVERVG